MINQDASDKADIETIFNDHENINTVTMFVFFIFSRSCFK